MANYKTPGVYIEEITKFPPSVAQVETAIPAFIGYTEKAERLNGDTLHLIPTRITSLLEYETYFGSAKKEDSIKVIIDDATDSEGELISRSIKVQQPENKQPFLTYYSLQMYFANGGGPCYIVSVKQYEDNAVTTIDKAELKKGLDKIELEDEPTLILFPDATNISDTAEYYALYEDALKQCNKLQDRFTIMDTKHFDEEAAVKPVDELRNSISLGKDFLKYGAAYYPHLETILDYHYNADDIIITHTATVPSAVPTALLSIKEAQPSMVTAVDKVYKEVSAVSLTGSLIDAIDFVYNDAAGFVTDKGAETATGATAAKSKTFANGELATLLTDLEAISELGKSILGDTDSAMASVSDEDSANDDGIDPFRTTLDAKLTIINAGIQALSDLSPRMKKAKNVGEAVALALEIAPELDKLATFTFVDPDYTAVTNEFTLINTQVTGIVDEITLVSSGVDTNNGAMNGRRFGSIEGIDNATFNTIKQEINSLPITLPPSSAMAGIYARVDASRGVWKAPANVGVSYVVKPTVQISHEAQGGMNVDTVAGKSVNAIRNFTGKGTLVWGARTLAGNDNEWRYINVRRFFNMVEESVGKATEQFVFEGNDANTWVRVRAMIENFLVLQWKAGALAGAKAEQAFYVRVGLGQTMTAQDILEGRMIIEIGMAAVRPAEFIILRFSHKMQEA